MDPFTLQRRIALAREMASYSIVIYILINLLHLWVEDAYRWYPCTALAVSLYMIHLVTWLIIFVWVAVYILVLS